ncbi:arylsulfatase [Alloactinosynnema sp. L-07]|uniref:hypothetical protein n=1 Tax=Alloactinosynnema sp. L-07 TaxID=1653480 RepID=UPI00065F06DA|nr:hypothetical protein [Alloactinosynnema sp. L-07]CRK56044.1 arylsulfatase [Alloactinosynnema sp. L-07]
MLFAHGDQGGGYVVSIEDGLVVLAYNAYGVMHRSEPIALPEGETRVALEAEALPEFRWALRLRVGAAAGELGPAPMMIGMAPFTGISVGADRGGPVDWVGYEREKSFPYTGTLLSVRYEPGKQADYDPALLARLWAEAERLTP